MRSERDYYYYVDCYCDGMIVMHKEPNHVFYSIRGKGFTIKETSSTDYFIGGDFERVKEPNTNSNILTWGYKTYFKRMMDNFKNTFGFEPSKKHAAMTPDFKPELETTELCNNTEKAQYWKCISEMQWAVALGRKDMMYANIVLSRCLPASHKVHLNNINHVYGYLNKYTSKSIKFNIEKHDYKKFNTIEGNWGKFYAGETEDLLLACLPLMCKPVLITSFADANLMADLTTGIYHTVIIHLMNRTLYIGTPNQSLASKLPPMVVNTPPLAFVLTIFLTFVITYSILESLYR